MIERRRTVVVYGATGFTGRRVVSELLVRKHRVVLAGRDADKLSRLAGELGGADLLVRPAALDDPSGLRALASEASVLVNCVGPFSASTPALATAAATAGAHYLDVSAEQGSAVWLSEHASAAAREARVAMVPGFAFFGAVADLLTTRVASDVRGVEEIEIAYRITGWRPPADPSEPNRGPRDALASSTITAGSNGESDGRRRAGSNSPHRSGDSE